MHLFLLLLNQFTVSSFGQSMLQINVMVHSNRNYINITLLNLVCVLYSFTHKGFNNLKVDHYST